MFIQVVERERSLRELKITGSRNKSVYQAGGKNDTFSLIRRTSMKHIAGGGSSGKHLPQFQSRDT